MSYLDPMTVWVAGCTIAMATAMVLAVRLRGEALAPVPLAVLATPEPTPDPQRQPQQPGIRRHRRGLLGEVWPSEPDGRLTAEWCAQIAVVEPQPEPAPPAAVKVRRPRTGTDAWWEQVFAVARARDAQRAAAAWARLDARFGPEWAAGVAAAEAEMADFRRVVQGVFEDTAEWRLVEAAAYAEAGTQ